MEYLKEFAIYFCCFFFILGFACTFLNGSIKTVKTCLTVIAIMFFLGSLAGLIFSRGLLIFLLPQLLVFYIFIALMIILGAAAGVLVHRGRKEISSSDKLKASNLAAYLPLPEFLSATGLEEDRVIKRIKSGFYLGGVFQGQWYVHKSERIVKES